MVEDMEFRTPFLASIGKSLSVGQAQGVRGKERLTLVDREFK